MALESLASEHLWFIMGFITFFSYIYSIFSKDVIKSQRRNYIMLGATIMLLAVVNLKFFEVLYLVLVSILVVIGAAYFDKRFQWGSFSWLILGFGFISEAFMYLLIFSIIILIAGAKLYKKASFFRKYNIYIQRYYIISLFLIYSLIYLVLYWLF